MRKASSLLFLLALASTGCDGAPSRKEKPGMAPAPSTTAAAIFERIGLPMPQGEIEFTEQMNGMDDAARVVLVTSYSEWKKLVGNLPLSAPDQSPFDEEANVHLGSDDGDWRPSQASGLQTTQFRWKNEAESLNIGKAPAGQGKIRLFVFWHQL